MGWTVRFPFSIIAILLLSISLAANASDRTWTGAGTDARWQNSANWGGTAPVAGDALRFSGATNLSPTNDFPSDTSFSGVTFLSGASTYNLTGNRVTLGGNIVNQSQSTQSVGIPLVINATADRSFDTTGGAMIFSSSISYANLGTTVRNYRKIGTNELVFTGITLVTNLYSRFTLDGGALRFASGSRFHLVDTSAERNIFHLGDVVNTKSAMIIESGADVALGGINLQTIAQTDSTSTFDLTVNGHLLLTGTDNTFGDQNGNRASLVVDHGGTLSNLTAGAWLNVGTRIPMTIELKDGTIWIQRLSLGRMDGAGDRQGGRADITIRRGLFYVNDAFHWMSTSWANRTNTVTLGNGITNIATLSTPAMSQASSTGTTILNLNGGSLECRAASSSFLSGLDQVNVLAGGAVIDTGSNAVTFVEAFTHAAALGSSTDGGLIKRGSGSLTLSGSPHSFNGPLRVEDGSIRIAGTMATNLAEITLAPGKTLRFLGSARQVLRPALLTLGDATTTSRLDFDVSSDGSDCDTIQIPVGGYLGKLNIYFWIRNSLALENAVTRAGDYPIFTYVSEPPDLALLTYANRSFGITSSFVVDRANKQVILRLATFDSEATWTNTVGSAWETASNWWPGVPASAPASRARFWSAISAPATITLDTDTTIGGISFSNAQRYTLTGTGALTLGDQFNSGYLTCDAGSHTVNLPLNLLYPITMNVPASQTFTLNGAITGNGGIVKGNPGTLLLTNANTFAGGITVSAGTLVIPSPNVLGTGPLTLSGGTASITATGDLTLENTLQSRAGGTFDVGSANISYAGALDWTGAGTLVKQGTGELRLSGSCNENSTNMLFNFRQGTTRLIGGARYSLRGTNRDVLQTTYGAAGQTSSLIIETNAVLSTGGMRLMAGGLAGTSTVDVVGGRLEMLDTEATIINSSGGRADIRVRNGGSLYQASPNWLELGVNGLGTLNIENGNVSVSLLTIAGYADNVGAGNRGGSAQITVGTNGTLEVRNYLTWITDNMDLTSWLRVNGGRLITPAMARSTGSTGTARLILNGGTLECSGLATYSSANAPVSTLTDYLYGVNEFQLGADGVTIDTRLNSLTITQPLTMEAGTATAACFTKTGAGSLTLSGANTFNAPVTVAAGTLALSALPANSLTVAAGASLVPNAGSVRTESLTDAAFATGSSLTLDLAEADSSDRLAVSGTLTLGSQVNIVLNSAQTGTFSLFTYTTLVGDVTALRVANPDAGLTYAFANTGSAITLTVSAATNVSLWANDVDGAWHTAANWTPQTVPDGAGHVARFDLDFASPRTVTLDGPATLGMLLFDSAAAPTLSGTDTLTLNNGATPALLKADQGAPVVTAALALSSDTFARIDPAALLTLAGNVSGSGSLSAVGGGTLVLAGTNTAAQTLVNDSTLTLGAVGSLEAPLTLDNATLTSVASAEMATHITSGPFGATVAPTTDTALTLSGRLDGEGGFAKTGSSTLTLDGTLAYRGATAVNGGTLMLATPPPAALTLGAGTLTYAGSDANLPGYTLNTVSSAVAAILRSAANLTVTGAVQTVAGSFVKTGIGTLSFTYPGAQTLGLANSSALQDALLNIGANGDAPTQGFNPFSVAEGTVTLGAPGQINTFAANLLVGHYTTASAGAETAAHLVITGGTTVVAGNLAVGRGNGNTTTAPTPLQSSVTINDGTISVGSFSLGHNGGNTVGFNAQPAVTVNGGNVTAGQINLAEHFGSAATFTLNNGTVTVTDQIRIGHQTSNGGGGNGTLTVNGGSLTLPNDINLGVTASATGTLQLAGGLVSARNVTVGSGTGRILFDGGTLRLTTGPLVNVQALVMAGGAHLEIDSGRYTFGVPLFASEASDGGLVKTGAGMLALDNSSNHTYTGPTLVEEGTLSLRGTSASLPAASELTVKPGAAFHVSSEVCAMPHAVTVSGLTLGSSENEAANAGLSLWLGTGNQTDSLNAIGNLSLGKVALSLYQVGTTSANPFTGIYPIIHYSGTDPNISRLTVANADPTLVYAFSVDSANKQVLLSVTTSETVAATALWTADVDGAWSVGSNWQSGSAPMSITSDAIFANVITQDRTVSIDTAASVGGLTFDSTNRYTLAGTETLTLNGSGETSAITLIRGNHTITAPLAVTAAENVSLETSGNTLTLAGNVAGGADSALTLDASGTVRITNSMCSAAVTVFAGTLEIGEDSQLNGTLRYSAGQITGTGNATVGGTVELPPGTKTLLVNANTTLAISGPVIGQGSLIKDSGGTLELSAANSYSGNTRVKAGTLAFRGSGTPGTGAISMEGGTLASAGSEAVSFSNSIGFTNDTTVQANAPMTTSGALFMASPHALTKQGTNTWSIGSALNGGGTNDAYHVYLRNGTLRFAEGSSFCMASTNTTSRNLFDVTCSQNGNALGLIVETNATVALGSIGVQFSSTAATGTFYMAINGGRLTVTAPDNPIGFGDQANLPITVAVNGGQWLTASDTAWCDLGTRSPLTWVQNGGFVSFGRPAFGRQNGAGSGRLFGGVNMSINGGTFEARQFFSWKSTDDASTTNTLTLGCGIPGQGTFSVPATKRFDWGGRIVLNFNGGVLETRGLCTLDSNLNGTLGDYLLGVNDLNVGAGGAVIDTLTNVVAIKQTLLPQANDGGLIKLGTGSLAFSNSVALTGPVTVSNGTLCAHFTQTNNMFLAKNSVFDAGLSSLLGNPALFRNVAGSGTFSNGTLSVIGTLSPGDLAGQAGTLSATDLTLNSGMTLRYDWTEQTNDLFSVSGLLSSQSSGTIDFGREPGNELPIPFTAVLGTYGTFSGTFDRWKAINTGLPARVAVSTTITAQNGVVRLNVVYSGLIILIR